jgi:hypothetical protein
VLTRRGRRTPESQRGLRDNGRCAAQASLQGLQTPAILVFLHLVPTVGALWLLCDVRPLQLKTLRGCSIQVALSGIQARALRAASCSESQALPVLMRRHPGARPASCVLQ